MFAIIKTGGKQYKVAEGDIIKVEKLDADVGDTVTFDDVKLLSKDEGAVTETKGLESVLADIDQLEQLSNLHAPGYPLLRKRGTRF